MWQRSPILVNHFLLYISSFSFFLSLSSCFPKAKTVLILKRLEGLSWNLVKYLSFFDSVSLIPWLERKSMPAKAHPSTQATGISVQLLFAWPEERALQKHPGRRRGQAGWWAEWYSKINHQHYADASINHLAQPHQWLIWSRKQRHYLIVRNTWVSESIWQRCSSNYSLQNCQICW